MGGPHGPPGMRPPPGPGHMGMPPGPNTFYPQHTSAPQVIEKPKVVYSAAPVRNVPAPVKEQVIPPSIVLGAPPVVQNVPSKFESVPRYEPPEIDMSHFAPGPSEGASMDGEELMEVTKKEKKEKKKKFVRTAAGTVWEDPTLAEWEQGMQDL